VPSIVDDNLLLNCLRVIGMSVIDSERREDVLVSYVVVHRLIAHGHVLTLCMTPRRLITINSTYNRTSYTAPIFVLNFAILFATCWPRSCGIWVSSGLWPDMAQKACKLGFRFISTSTHRVTTLQSQTPRAHSRLLPEHSTHLSDCNFLTGMLYNNTY